MWMCSIGSNVAVLVYVCCVRDPLVAGVAGRGQPGAVCSGAGWQSRLGMGQNVPAASVSNCHVAVTHQDVKE